MDYIYLLMLLIPLAAQIYVKYTYNKYRKCSNSDEVTGYDVARKILDSNGLNDIYIVETSGTMTDHYDPKRKIIRLSKEVYSGDSIAAMAIAAHECGHAIQDKENYIFLRIRSLIYPIVHLGTSLSYYIIFIGILFETIDLVMFGIILVSLGLLFQLVTLPTEINASKRAKENLELLDYREDSDGVKTMLTSAALTYVAGVLASALEVLRLLMIFDDKRD